MKLYATVSSERATKGQGGNDYIDILLKVGSAKEPLTIGCLTLRNHGDRYSVIWQDSDGRETLVQEGSMKGEKQKGEEDWCGSGHPFYTEGCRDCADNIPF